MLLFTKLIQNKISRYFTRLAKNGKLSKPEVRCIREMVLGILKKQTPLVNKIASGIRDTISLSQSTKRLRNHYNKKDFYLDVLTDHLQAVKDKIYHGDYLLVDGSDIQKRYARFMEGLDFVKDGDKGTVGLGYWLMNILHAGKQGELMPLFQKLYSFDCGSLSENKEVKQAIDAVKSVINKAVTWVFDRGMDRPILRDYIIENTPYFILRLMKTTKLIYRGKELSVGEISRKVVLGLELFAIKIDKSKKKRVFFKCGAVRVSYMVAGKKHDLWLVVTKRPTGGYCWLLTKSPKDSLTEVIREAFKGYGLRWKIEEYHRHVKEQYNLEKIQIKTFEGLQSMWAIFTVAMSIIYRELAGLHTRLILESGIKTLNKETIGQLCNFIYYKIGEIVSELLANTSSRPLLPQLQQPHNTGQLCFDLEIDT